MTEKDNLGTVLIIDDEAYVRDSLSLVLERRGFQVRTAASGQQALSSGCLDGLDAAITDLRMPGQDGLELLRKIKKRQPGLPVIILTAYGDVPAAVECIKAGAYEFLEKPVDNEQLAHILRRALKEGTITRELEFLRTSVGTGSFSRTPVGESVAWKEILETVELVAPTDSSVLLLGESGTGKEEVARLIHRKSRRSGHTFVGVNCAAVPLDLFESEFFGHRKGAFTGAARDRDG
ncbi:MAG: sigma-54-dependent transcriptional regulator, partial [bacterium]